MKTLAIALATVAALGTAGAVSAQDNLVAPALSMLEISVGNALNQLGIDEQVMGALTLAQLGEIKGILSTTDDPEQKKQDVQRVIDQGA